MKKLRIIILLVPVMVSMVFISNSNARAQTSIDTGQEHCYNVEGSQIPCPAPGEALFGQDANYVKSDSPAYQDNGDGTITDLHTGLMWQKEPNEKMTWTQAMQNAESFTLAGYDDWRMPTIKELYSLMDFEGRSGADIAHSVPYINTDYFVFYYGDEASGERIIDAQSWTSTEYVSVTGGGIHTVFGVNFADGRIKGYGTSFQGRGDVTQYSRYVRGSADYGTNSFIDNGDGTITDNSTGLMWLQDDSGSYGAGAGSRGDGSVDWEEALNWCETLTVAGYDDWRLPDIKELQYIVDYSRSPDTSNSPAIDPIFNSTSITNEVGQTDYPYIWSSTTHIDGFEGGSSAAYMAFGRALGSINNQLTDVHGAGAQRSDPKVYPADGNFDNTFGPQGDIRRIYNYARCVRGSDYEIFTGGTVEEIDMGFPAGGPGSSRDGQQQGQQPSGGNGQPPGGNGQPPGDG